MTAIIAGNNEMVFQLLYQLSDAQNRKMQHANSLFLLQAAVPVGLLIARLIELPGTRRSKD